MDEPRRPLQRRQARQRSPESTSETEANSPAEAAPVMSHSRLAFTRIHPLEVREVLIVSASRRDPARVDVRSRVGVRKALKSEIAWRLLPRRAVAVERLGKKVHRDTLDAKRSCARDRGGGLGASDQRGELTPWGLRWDLPAIRRKRRKRRGSMSLSLLTACWNGSATSRGRSIPTHGGVRAYNPAMHRERQE